MATIKSYTNLQQSKKLAEILPIESADMSWVSCDNGRQKYYQAENRKIILNYEKIHWLPCWSLAALLTILDFPSLTQNKENEWEVCVFDINNDDYIKKTASNPVDACVDMILKLHELKML